MKEIILSNDKILRFDYTSFLKASKLQRELLSQLSESKIDLTNDLAKKNKSVDSLIKGFFKLSSSEKLEHLAIESADKCLIDSEKINLQYFERPENWSIYYEVLLEVVTNNLEPFFFESNYTIRKVTGETSSKVNFKVKDEFKHIVYYICSLGFFGGDPFRVETAGVNHIVECLDYISFTKQMEINYLESIKNE